MISLIGWKPFGIFAAGLFILAAAIRFLISPPESLIGFFMLFAGGGFFLSIVVSVIGQTPAFPLFTRLPLVNKWLPDINGNWKGNIDSNWPIIAEKFNILDHNGQPFRDQEVPVSVNIKVRLLTISIRLHSDSGYQNSHTLAAALHRDSHGGYELAYVYRSAVPKNKISDEQSFMGAGILNFEDNQPLSLNGNYWTNRSWTKGLNTAGTIRLKRHSV